MAYCITQKNPMNQLRGLRNREAGKDFERMILDACEFYREKGIAEIDKTPEPMKILRSLSSGQFVACFEKKAQPDFKGTLDGGRTICFEAKHTDSDRILKNAVSDEQATMLNKHMKMGALCYVIVSFRFEKFYRIPWSTWLGMKTFYGRYYIKPEDNPPYQIKFNGILDYLGIR